MSLQPKPNWDKAPEWATAWCCDSTGRAHWLAIDRDKMPTREEHLWHLETAYIKKHERDGHAVDHLTVHKFTPAEFICARGSYIKLPKWAQYVTIDKNGSVCVFDSEPKEYERSGYLNDGRMKLLKGAVEMHFEHRPESKAPQQVTATITLPTSEPPSQDSWDDAPDWAEWRAKDQNGAKFYYEEEPRKGQSSWLAGLARTQRIEHRDWEQSLEKRPPRSKEEIKQKLVDEVLEEMRREFTGGDITAVEGMLMLVPEEVLKGYLPEKI